MAVVNLSGDIRSTGSGTAIHGGEAGTIKQQCAKHFTVGSADSATSTYLVGRVSLSDRCSPLSFLLTDDLASSGSPTFDIGLFPVNGNFTADDDALNDGINVYSAANSWPGVSVIKDPIANGGKQYWEFISGLTENPGGFADVKITLKDADVNTGGDVYCALFGTNN